MSGSTTLNTMGLPNVFGGGVLGVCVEEIEAVAVEEVEGTFVATFLQRKLKAFVFPFSKRKLKAFVLPVCLVHRRVPLVAASRGVQRAVFCEH